MKCSDLKTCLTAKPKGDTHRKDNSSM